jgi:hypothetical protein
MPVAVTGDADRLDLVGRTAQLLDERADAELERGRGVKERGGVPGVLREPGEGRGVCVNIVVTRR